MDSFHQKLKFLYIGFIVVIGIFTMVIGFFLLQPDFSKLEAEKELINPNSNLKEANINLTNNCDDECWYNKAFEDNIYSFEECKNIESDRYRQQCFNDVELERIIVLAVDEDNIDVCNDLPEGILRNNCRDNYYLVKVLKTQNTSFCDRVLREDLKNGCY